MNCTFNINNHSLIDLTDWHHTHSWRAYRPLHLVQILISHRWQCCAKNRLQHRENSRLSRSRFCHLPRSSVYQFTSQLIQSCLQKVVYYLFKCKREKSDDKVHQSQLSKRWSLSVQAVLLYTMLGCCVVTHVFCFNCVKSLKTNGPAITIAINTYHE